MSLASLMKIKCMDSLSKVLHIIVIVFSDIQRDPFTLKNLQSTNTPFSGFLILLLLSPQDLMNVDSFIRKRY